MNDKMKNLVVRTISGLGLTVVVLGGILWSQWSLGAVLLLLLVGGVVELYALIEKQGLAPQRALGMMAAVMLFVLNFALVSDDIQVLYGGSKYFVPCVAFFALLIPLMFICELYRKQANPAANIATTILPLFYVALPLSLMLYMPIIGRESWNAWVLIAYVAIVWSNDVFAYLVGIAIGRHRLFERLSPKKSWEGFFGGVAGAVVAGLIAAHLLGDKPLAWVGLALVTVVTAVFGDLAESMFKRAAEVKDSGTLIPGHGGVLDRFDAMLLSAPFVFVYMLCIF
ncbi:MAG: phosphatidate cytidylyltransferase [Rikenellaceae bacterium]|nr:phosphatidate cytidylyltransferase [Rikenellaceae bacterium]